MSKPVKELVRNELVRRFEGLTQLAVVGFTGLDANATNQIRGRLREKQIRLAVVKNALARQAFKALGLDAATDLLRGPSAIAYATDSENVGIVTVVRELLEIHKEAPTLTVKAAYMDGDVFGEDQINALSKYPTRDEAIAQLVHCVLSPGSNVSGCLVGPGGQIAGVLKAIEEKAGDDEDNDNAEAA